jgi:hemolysin III
MAIYGATLVLLFAASTLYHAIPAARWKRVLRKFDHAAIFLLIAGTYTPFLLVNLRGPWGWSMFGVVWGRRRA